MYTQYLRELPTGVQNLWARTRLTMRKDLTGSLVPSQIRGRMDFNAAVVPSMN